MKKIAAYVIREMISTGTVDSYVVNVRLSFFHKVLPKNPRACPRVFYGYS